MHLDEDNEARYLFIKTKEKNERSVFRRRALSSAADSASARPHRRACCEYELCVKNELSKRPRFARVTRYARLIIKATGISALTTVGFGRAKRRPAVGVPLWVILGGLGRGVGKKQVPRFYLMQQNWHLTSDTPRGGGRTRKAVLSA